MFWQGKKKTISSGPSMSGLVCQSCGARVSGSVTRNSSHLCLFCFARIIDTELHILRRETLSVSKPHFQVLALH